MLVDIVWEDAAYESGWSSEAPELARCVTVGHLIEETTKTVTIAHTKNGESKLGQLVIPKGCILSMCKLCHGNQILPT